MTSPFLINLLEFLFKDKIPNDNPVKIILMELLFFFLMELGHFILSLKFLSIFMNIINFLRKCEENLMKTPKN